MPDSQRYSWNPYLINNVEGIVIFSMFKCFKFTTKCFPAVEMRKSPSKRNHNLKNQFLKSWTLISYWYLILDTWYLILDTWYLILDTWYLILDTWCLVVLPLQSGNVENIWFPHVKSAIDQMQLQFFLAATPFSMIHIIQLLYRSRLFAC